MFYPAFISQVNLVESCNLWASLSSSFRQESQDLREVLWGAKGLTESVLWITNYYTALRWCYYYYSAGFFVVEWFPATKYVGECGPYHSWDTAWKQGAISSRSPEDFQRQRHWRLNGWMRRNLWSCWGGLQDPHSHNQSKVLANPHWDSQDSHSGGN